MWRALRIHKSNSNDSIIGHCICCSFYWLCFWLSNFKEMLERWLQKLWTSLPRKPKFYEQVSILEMRFNYKLITIFSFYEITMAITNWILSYRTCESSALHHTESGYTTAPCNNHIAASTTSSTSSSNSTASSAVSNGTNSTNNGSSNNIITSDIISASNDRKPKNSNLLVNIQDKTEPEKNNLSTAAETSIIYNGTIPRNGTLCKKVYL